MKIQSKVAACSLATIIISTVFSFLLVCFKDLYIEKWFDYLVAILLGLLTNSTLLLVISVITFYQIRREYSRRILVELNIFREEYYILNALILPCLNEADEIRIPDSDLRNIENSLAKLNDIAMRILCLDRISQPIISLCKKHSGEYSKIATIEDAFFQELNEFIRQCHDANNAFRLACCVKDEPTHKLCQSKLQSSISKIIELSRLEGEFNIKLNGYLEINKKILKITTGATNENATVE